MDDDSSDTYKEGFRRGDEYQRYSNAHPWRIGAGLGPEPPSKYRDGEYNQGVSDGRKGVRRGRFLQQTGR